MSLERRQAVMLELRRRMTIARLTPRELGDAANVPPPLVRRFIDGEAGIPAMHFNRLDAWLEAQPKVKTPPPAPLPEPGLPPPARERVALAPRSRLEALEIRIARAEDRVAVLERLVVE